MKKKESSDNTKKALGAALKEMMEKKPLDKITVGELVQQCGVSRNTFYYHFEDIRGLLKWVLESEAVEVVARLDPINDAEEAVLFIIKYIDENRKMLDCAWESLGRDELRGFLYPDFVSIVDRTIRNLEKENNITVGDDFRLFLTECISEALAAMMISGIRDKGHMKDRDRLIKYVMKVSRTVLPQLLISEAEEQQKNK